MRSRRWFSRIGFSIASLVPTGAWSVGAQVSESVVDVPVVSSTEDAWFDGELGYEVLNTSFTRLLFSAEECVGFRGRLLTKRTDRVLCVALVGAEGGWDPNGDHRYHDDDRRPTDGDAHGVLKRWLVHSWYRDLQAEGFGHLRWRRGVGTERRLGDEPETQRERLVSAKAIALQRPIGRRDARWTRRASRRT